MKKCSPSTMHWSLESMTRSADSVSGTSAANAGIGAMKQSAMPS